MSFQNIGFLNINKPKNWTSHDVVAKLRAITKIKQIGHCGTLDPLATGVLVVGINSATRLLEYLPSDKEYLADIIFGIKTTTDDITGKVIKKTNEFPDLQGIKNVLKQFTGKIKQKPPVFSAIKIKGERAYNLARENKISLDEIKEKTVEIFFIEIVSYTEGTLHIKIHCSSGTYIRSLARDLGEKLNSFGTLSALKRTKVGSFFKVEDSIQINQLETYCNMLLQQFLISPERVINLKKIQLSHKNIQSLVLGKSIREGLINDSYVNKEVQILTPDDKLVGIAFVNSQKEILPKKILIHSV